MPTEQQFEEAGARFDTAADGADELLRPTRQANGRTPLHGGELTRDVNGFIDDTGRELTAIAGELRELAGTCRQRAQECRDAASALAAYRAAMTAHGEAMAEYAVGVVAASANPGLPPPAEPGPPPSPPPTPPPYVDI